MLRINMNKYINIEMNSKVLESLEYLIENL